MGLGAYQLQIMDTERNVIYKKRGGEYEFIIDQTSCRVYHEADMNFESSIKKSKTIANSYDITVNFSHSDPGVMF